MKIAVIVLNYNSSDDCKKCIGYLLRQENVELDIVVVDNCSYHEDRAKLEAILSEFTNTGNHKITYIPNDINKGYNAGNNIGLRYASSQGLRYSLIANPDMEFPNVSYIYDMAKKMEENSIIVVEGTDIVNNDGAHQNPQREMTYLEELFWPIQLVKSLRGKTWYTLDYTKSVFCDKISGCCLMVRMSFIEKIGYFDENVFLYSEEPILGAQVRNAGCRILYNSSLQAIHRHVESSKGEVKPRMKLLFKSRWYYLKTYTGYSKCSLFLLRLSKTIQRLLFT